MKRPIPGTILLTVATMCASGCITASWTPGQGPLATRWAADVTPDSVLPEYPRPQMVRADWLSLNGPWDLALVHRDDPPPRKFDHAVLVPFPVESALSGVMTRVDETQRLWYRRTFSLPREWSGQRVLLHFGAVDWEALVFVNGHEAGMHRGGYDGFTLDITDHLKSWGTQELIVAVWDPTDAGGQPTGKQRKKPGGIFYTPTTGIWQTVWLEPVPQTRIDRILLTPDVDGSCLRVVAEIDGARGPASVEVVAGAEGRQISRAVGMSGREMLLPIDNPILWSPASPFLYNLEIILRDDDGHVIDRVTSYFGMRKISLGQDRNGALRMLLNYKFVFQVGLLDQGFWPDGLYTAPTDAALRSDIEMTRQMGFNVARKHVKVEPARWYYWCDRLGLLVWQDMPSGANRTNEDKAQFELELRRMIAGLRNHPCIVMWVPFNEGWGQYDTARIVADIQQMDPSRLVNNASGWHDRAVGDVHDIHAYPGPAAPPPETERAGVLGEFGGLGLRVASHMWEQEGWGYALYQDREALANQYEDLLGRVWRLKDDAGLSAAIYTQTTDVETETNGLMTYDREIVKIDLERLSAASRGYTPPTMVTLSEIFTDTALVGLECARPGATIQYTLDGSAPTWDSRPYDGPFEVADTTTIKARAHWADGEESHTRTFVVTRVPPVPALEIDGLQPGLQVSYYEGKWDALPDFETLTPVATGVAEQFDLSFEKREQHYALRFDGHITVPETGVYIFFVTSDDGTRLSIAGRDVVANDGIHGAREQHGYVPLEAGTHPISLVYFQAHGGRALKVDYQGPGIDRQPVPASALGHIPS